jgi:L-fuculose-phosphate aldolase
MNQELALRRTIVEVGRLLYERKLVVATDGNLSVRLDRKHILITPSGFCKGFLSEQDIVRLPLTAGRLPPRAGASTETPMHLATYRTRKDIAAIIHAHPPYATRFAVSGRKLNAGLLPETRLFDGPIGRVPYVAPGSARLAQATARALKSHNFCLLARHGAVAVGRDLLDAYYRLERLEFLAQITLLKADQ